MEQSTFFSRYKYNLRSDLIGGGGFGKVYKAYDDVRDRYVAIKIAEFDEEYEQLSLFSEVNLSKSLPDHKNIAYYEDCYRFEMPNGVFDYGILQYYPDGNLSDVIKRNQLSDVQKLKIANGVINGLAFLHENHIVHRDLKSSNILISKRDNEFIPKITDFGLSKNVGNINLTFKTNSFIGGSIKYSAPEQLLNTKTKGNVDIWSLGVILFEIFIGKVPFDIDKEGVSNNYLQIDAIKKITSGAIPLEINEIPEPYQTIIRQCLVVDPDKRIQSVNTILNKIEAIIVDRAEPISLSDNTTMVFNTKSKASTLRNEPKTKINLGQQSSTGETNKAPKKRLLVPFFIGSFLLIALLSSLLFLKRDFSVLNKDGKYFIQSDMVLKDRIYDSIQLGYFSTPKAYINDTVFYLDKYGAEIEYTLLMAKTKVESIVSITDSLQSQQGEIEQKNWEVIEKSGDIKEMERFIKEFPQSDKIATIKKRIQDKILNAGVTNEDELWNVAVTNNSEEAFRLFIEKYPKSKKLSTAKDAIKKLHQKNEEDYWEKIVSQNNIVLFQDYLKTYPNGKFNDIATSSITNINKELENKQWDEVKVSNNPEAIRSFIHLYPKSPYISEANKIIENFSQSRKPISLQEIQPTESLTKPSDKPNSTDNEEISPLILEIEDIMVKVPGGKHYLGCSDENCAKDAQPVTEINIASFQISKIEVTQSIYQKVMNENPSEFKKCLKCPVENVSYYDAIKFIEKLNKLSKGKYKYRLPSEAEWEYAAAASTQQLYAGGQIVEQIAILKTNNNSGTSEVGSKKQNAFGIYDMSGNVYEWCETWYNPNGYLNDSFQKSKKVIRGGSWNSIPDKCRIKARSSSDPSEASPTIGFRIIRN